MQCYGVITETVSCVVESCTLLVLSQVWCLHVRQCIDAVLARVDSMVALVQDLDYSPLERANAGRWASVRAQFNSINEEVKAATRDLINTCFRCATPLRCLMEARLT